MRKLLMLLITLIFLIPTSVLAQDSAALKSLNVRLWSEYDQPSMLVILNFELTDDTTVPTTLDFRVPSEANITAVAYDNAGELLIANYQITPTDDGNWQTIKLIASERTTYHIEYYQPLDRSGNKRSFTYQWTGDYPVSELDIEVQVPQDSTEVKANPAIPFMQSQPFLNGGAKISNLKEGQTYRLNLEYSRTSEAPVVTPPPSSDVQPLEAVDENTDGRSTLDNLPLFLGGFGAVLILAALIYFMRGQSIVDESKPRKRKNRSLEAGSQIYCHECGSRANEGDRFCRTCGSKLRSN